ncbi:hypothetical protein JW926_03615 [Candidatus Sumerlaeota bacterium]|nr:hypothetical protein [Candidatus Sumerlaeota bacterium]
MSSLFIRFCGSGGVIHEWREIIRSVSLYDYLSVAPVVIILLGILYLGLKIGPRYSDAVDYQLVAPVKWYQTRSLDWDGMGAHSWPSLSRVHGFPNTSGIVAYHHLAFTGNLYAGALKQASFALMGLVALYSLSRMLGIRRRLAIIVIYFALFTPEFLLQFSEGYADLAMAGGLVTSLLFLFLFISSGGYKWLVLCCIGTGLVGGIKNTGIIFSFSLFLIISIYLIKIKAPMRRIYGMIALFSAFWLLLAAPWYLHNVIRYANPLYPIEVKFFGHQIFKGPFPVNQYTRAFMEKRTDSYLEAIWITYREDSPGISLAQMFAGLGSGFFILGVPALAISFIIALFKRDKGFMTVWLSFLTVYLFQTVKWHARFTLYLAFFSGLCLVWLMQNFRKPGRLVLGLFLSVCLLFNAAKSITSVASVFQPPDFLFFSHRTGDFSPQQFDHYPGYYSVRQYVREHFAEKNNTLYYFPHVGAISLMPKDMKLRMITFPAENKNQWFRYMLKENVDYIYDLRPEKFGNFIDEERWLNENSLIFQPVIMTVSSGLHRGRFYGERIAVERLYRIDKDALIHFLEQDNADRERD